MNLHQMQDRRAESAQEMRAMDYGLMKARPAPSAFGRACAVTYQALASECEDLRRAIRSHPDFRIEGL